MLKDPHQGSPNFRTFVHFLVSRHIKVNIAKDRKLVDKKPTVWGYMISLHRSILKWTVPLGSTQQTQLLKVDGPKDWKWTYAIGLFSRPLSTELLWSKTSYMGKNESIFDSPVLKTSFYNFGWSTLNFIRLNGHFYAKTG